MYALSLRSRSASARQRTSSSLPRKSAWFSSPQTLIHWRSLFLRVLAVTSPYAMSASLTQLPKAKSTSMAVLLRTLTLEPMLMILRPCSMVDSMNISQV